MSFTKKFTTLKLKSEIDIEQNDQVTRDVENAKIVISDEAYAICTAIEVMRNA